MAWSDVTLSTPQSIARFEKEINTITTAAVEEVLYEDALSEGTLSNSALSDSYKIADMIGFAKIGITATNTAEGNITLKLYDSVDDETFEDTGIHIVLEPSESYEMKLISPITINDYIKFYISKDSSVTAEALKIQIESAWDDKHNLAKEIIANEILPYISGDLDDIENPDELNICADYLCLHLIYADLVLGYGENEIYSGKMKFYFKQYGAALKKAIRRMTIAGTNVIYSSKLRK